MFQIRFTNVFWIDASNDETIKQSFKCIHVEPGKTGTVFSDSPDSILRSLSRLSEPWLLIFDNADGSPDVIEPYLPYGRAANALITSRNPGLRSLVDSGAYLSVDALTEEDALALFLKAALLSKASEDHVRIAKTIVEKLWYLALAVDQAGAYIGQGYCSIESYLEIFSKHSKELLNHSAMKGASQYNRAVYETFEMSYLAIERQAFSKTHPENAKASQNALLIFNIITHITHEGVMMETFRRAAHRARQSTNQSGLMEPNRVYEGYNLDAIRADLSHHLLQLDDRQEWDSYSFQQGMQILLSLSLVKANSSGDVFDMHPLLHFWMNERVPAGPGSVCQRYALIALTLLTDSMPQSVVAPADFYYWLKCCYNILPHYKLYYVVRRTDSALDEYVELGCRCLEDGRYEDAVEMFSFVRQDSHDAVLSSTWLFCMVCRAISYAAMGLWDMAREKSATSLSSRLTTLGETHYGTLSAMVLLAICYDAQGDSQMAEDLITRAVRSAYRAVNPVYFSQRHIDEVPSGVLKQMRSKRDNGLWLRKELYSAERRYYYSSYIYPEDIENIDQRMSPRPLIGIFEAYEFMGRTDDGRL